MRMSMQANRPVPSGLHRGIPYSRAPAISDVVALIGREMVEAEQILGETLRETTPAVAEINAYLAKQQEEQVGKHLSMPRNIPRPR